MTFNADEWSGAKSPSSSMKMQGDQGVKQESIMMVVDSGSN